ncbi:MAG: hypothetical protein PVJ72_18055 [Gammaproteobacteria bacterium]
MHRYMCHSLITLCLFGLLMSLLPVDAGAVPVFARKYNLTCITCHVAFPKLNAFGQQFMASNYRLDNWKDATVDTGDDQLALPDQVPLAIRAQAFFQGRSAEAVDIATGEKTQADTDFQAPYLIKLISSAPLSDHITYYFYGIFAEKGGNGETVIEDAWFSHDDVFGSGVSLMLGQFQVSDLMFPRETRLTFQDYMVYRLAGITYERGAVFGRDFGPLDLNIGVVNGNGIDENVTINSPGYQRPDHLFDNNNSKAVFARLGGDIGPVTAGLFAYSGKQKNATGEAGTSNGDRDTDKRVAGLDLSGQFGPTLYWYGQYLWNQWDGFIDANTKYQWTGLFAGLDWVPGNKWAYSFLYNYADGGDFDNTDTVYEGVDVNSLTVNTSYYFMRNVKGVVEANFDLQDKETQSGMYYTGHLTQEHYVLFGFDAAF